jgi:hypothetical protein
MTTTSHQAQAADIDVFAPTAQAEGIAAGSSSVAAPTPKRMARAFEGLLALPTWLVLAAMWVAGAALMGSLALVVYEVGSVVLGAVVGSL